jgi:hypothetical protein
MAVELILDPVDCLDKLPGILGGVLVHPGGHVTGESINDAERDLLAGALHDGAQFVPDGREGRRVHLDAAFGHEEPVGREFHFTVDAPGVQPAAKPGVSFAEEIDTDSSARQLPEPILPAGD